MRPTTAALWLLLFFVLACKKPGTGEPTPTPPPAPTQPPPAIPANHVKGKIVLPNGSNVQLAGTVVITPRAEASVQDSSFVIDTTKHYHSLQILKNAQDKVLMMKYHYPGQPDYDISPRSTAIAMVMTSPIMHNIRKDNRATVINAIVKDTSFNTLVQQVTTTIQSGKFPTDTTNNALVAALKNVFKFTASFKIMDDQISQNPIKIEKMNGIVQFTNSAACMYRVGVYKDNQYVKELELKAMQYWPSTWQDLISGRWGLGYSNPDTKSFEIMGNGTYEFRIANGNMFQTSNTSVENRNAQADNLSMAISNIVSFYVPDLFEHSDCYFTLVERIKSLLSTNIETLSSPSTGAVEALGNYVHNMALEVMKANTDLLKNCTGVDATKSNRFLIVGKLWAEMVNFVGKTGEGINIGTQVVHWANAKTNYSVCYKMANNVLTTCGMTVKVQHDFPGSFNNVEAIITGGTAPFQYQWVNGHNGYSNFGDKFTLKSNGYYYVEVTDAAGQKATSDTLYVNDVTVTSFKTQRLNNSPNVTLTVEWSANRGLIPEFLFKTKVNGADAYFIDAFIEQGPAFTVFAPTNQNFCTSGAINSISPTTPQTITIGQTGGKYTIEIPANTQATQTGTVKLKFLDQNAGTSVCPANTVGSSLKYGISRTSSW